MTRNSKDGFSETWFLSGNSVHFEIYDRVTSLDNPKTIINYKRHTEYIKTMVHGISLNSMCVVKGFHIRSVFSFKSPWFMIKESEIWDSDWDFEGHSHAMELIFDRNIKYEKHLAVKLSNKIY